MKIELEQVRKRQKSYFALSRVGHRDTLNTYPHHKIFKALCWDLIKIGKLENKMSKFPKIALKQCKKGCNIACCNITKIIMYI